ncbi:MAG: preprotein translocase subunit SecG [Candidatus Desulfofervidus auxilii]|nr:preprotein translocase subunit SecG [Candidatus Desulfofervidus auxilii]
MFTVLIILHILICLSLIFIILLQRGRGAEMGVTFGGVSQTLFGPGGSMDFLNKVTTILAILFFITSLSLSYLAAKKQISPIEKPPISQNVQTEKTKD